MLSVHYAIHSRCSQRRSTRRARWVWPCFMRHCPQTISSRIVHSPLMNSSRKRRCTKTTFGSTSNPVERSTLLYRSKHVSTPDSVAGQLERMMCHNVLIEFKDNLRYWLNTVESIWRSVNARYVWHSCNGKVPWIYVLFFVDLQTLWYLIGAFFTYGITNSRLRRRFSSNAKISTTANHGIHRIQT